MDLKAFRAEIDSLVQRDFPGEFTCIGWQTRQCDDWDKAIVGGQTLKSHSLSAIGGAPMTTVLSSPARSIDAASCRGPLQEHRGSHPRGHRVLKCLEDIWRELFSKRTKFFRSLG